MTRREPCKLPRTFIGIFLILFSAITGCGLNTPKKTPVEDEVAKKKVKTPPPVVPETPVNPAGLHMVPLDPNLHQPFEMATILERPNENLRQPPEKTIAGKRVYKIYEKVVGKEGEKGLWDQIRFISETGNKLKYTAIIKTAKGNMVMELWPEIAPNHVRNFVALAKAGYYNGLSFDRTFKQELPGEDDQYWEYIEGGCPKGGLDGYGHIGYWLKPEITDKVSHEPGSVGASHFTEVETAACKFYISLNKAPQVDGQYTLFGKITKGLDVARTIHSQPKADALLSQPRSPVVIQQITIQVEEVAKEKVVKKS